MWRHAAEVVVWCRRLRRHRHVFVFLYLDFIVRSGKMESFSDFFLKHSKYNDVTAVKILKLQDFKFLKNATKPLFLVFLLVLPFRLNFLNNLFLLLYFALDTLWLYFNGGANQRRTWKIYKIEARKKFLPVNEITLVVLLVGHLHVIAFSKRFNSDNLGYWMLVVLHNFVVRSLWMKKLECVFWKIQAVAALGKSFRQFEFLPSLQI